MILTVGSDDGLRERVAHSLLGTQWATTVSAVASVGEAQELIRSSAPPRVIVVGRSVGVDGAGEVAAAASALRMAPLVLLIGTPTAAVLRQAMRAGVRDVLPPDFGQEDIVSTLREAGVSTGGPDALPGLTVAVFSTKGGVGTSVMASNLAVLLAERVGTGSTLIDLDLASADQSIMHGLAPKWTIQDLADGHVALDEESLGQVLVPVEGSSVHLLPGPVDPALAETITSADVGSVVAAVRAQSHLAVLDLAAAFDDRTLTALDAADVVVLVSSLDVAALRSLSVSLQTLERLGVEPTKVLISLVRVDSKSGLNVADVERAIDRSIDAGIPSTRAVPRSVNEGAPLAVTSPRSPVVLALNDLVELLVARLPDGVVEDDETASGRRSGFRLPFGRRDSGEQEEATPSATPRPPSPPTRPLEAATTEAPDADADEPEQANDNVRPIRVRREDAPSPRRVRRTPAAEDTDEVRPVEPAPADPPMRAVSGLGALPPPAVGDDDGDDDQPRRRRRR